MQFKQVVGQENLKNKLIDEVNQNKISHAQLFYGKPGYGSFALALAFVQYIFCTNKQTKDSCGECSNCRRISTLQHPDIHFSFPTIQALSKLSSGLYAEWREQLLATAYFDLMSWIKKTDDKERKPIISAEESQEIIKKLSLKSYEGGYKVLFIWMAEEMNNSSANKLLKLIEEPPPKTLILLICNNIELVLPTILSRAQLIKVPKISLEELVTHLTSEQNVSQSAAITIAGRSEGDLLMAEALATQESNQEDNRNRFIDLMRCCYKKDVILMLDWAESVANLGKEEQKGFIIYAIHMFRQSLLKNYLNNQLVNVSDEEDDFLKNFSRFITGNNINDFSSTFNDAHYHIDRNANGKLLFTNLCFKVMRYIHAA
jgi:DNA polymerase-3 subunit delta'